MKGCICETPRRNEDGTYAWVIKPECEYHRMAAENPDDHTIPWNCPTYWDGCNCDTVPTPGRGEGERRER